MNKSMYKNGVTLLFLWSSVILWAQDAEEKEENLKKDFKESTNITYDANQELIQNNFVDAEAEYRKAISKSATNTAAPYNLGRAYYNREEYAEAFSRFKEAGEKADEIFQQFDTQNTVTDETSVDAANFTGPDKPDEALLEAAMKHAHEEGVHSGMTRAMVIRSYPK